MREDSIKKGIRRLKELSPSSSKQEWEECRHVAMKLLGEVGYMEEREKDELYSSVLKSILWSLK